MNQCVSCHLDKYHSTYANYFLPWRYERHNFDLSRPMCLENWTQRHLHRLPPYVWRRHPGQCYGAAQNRWGVTSWKLYLPQDWQGLSEVLMFSWFRILLSLSCRTSCWNHLAILSSSSTTSSVLSFTMSLLTENISNLIQLCKGKLLPVVGCCIFPGNHSHLCLLGAFINLL